MFMNWRQKKKNLVIMATLLCSLQNQLKAQDKKSAEQELLQAVQKNDVVLAAEILKGSSITSLEVNNIRTSMNNPLLILSVMEGKKEMAKLLLQNGADVNARNKAQSTAVIWAARLGYNGLLQLLIEAKADLNVQNLSYKDMGMSALMYAARNGEEESVKLLLANGADRKLKNAQGQTALDIVRAQLAASAATSAENLSEKKKQKYAAIEKLLAVPLAPAAPPAPPIMACKKPQAEGSKSVVTHEGLLQAMQDIKLKAAAHGDDQREECGPLEALQLKLKSMRRGYTGLESDDSEEANDSEKTVLSQHPQLERPAVTAPPAMVMEKAPTTPKPVTGNNTGDLMAEIRKMGQKPGFLKKVSAVAVEEKKAPASTSHTIGQMLQNKFAELRERNPSTGQGQQESATDESEWQD